MLQVVLCIPRRETESRQLFYSGKTNPIRLLVLKNKVSKDSILGAEIITLILTLQIQSMGLPFRHINLSFSFIWIYAP